MASVVLHNAARDGYLDKLREATRKECNAPDEDGMTPTLWAAHAGKLDSLRLLVGRGGDPNKCDHYGNTALHLAAANGHKDIVMFLISFGINLWALDNDHHTAKEVAGMHDRQDIMKCLDVEAARQTNMNPKKAMSYKDKALTDVEKRLKELQKLQKKAEKKALKEDKKMKQSELIMAEQGGGNQPNMLHRDSTVVYAAKVSRPYSELVNDSNPKKKTVGGALSKKIMKVKNQNTINSLNGGGTVNSSAGDFKVTVIEDGKQTVKSLTGLRRDSEVMYANKIGGDQQRATAKDLFDESPEVQKQAINRAMSTPDLMEDPAYMMLMHQRQSIFNRPGMGDIAFRRGTAMGDAMMSATEAGDKRSDRSDSIGSAGSLAHRNKSRAPWTEDEINMDEEDVYEYGRASPIAVFLTAHDLGHLLHNFTREKVDLEALMLLTESDLKELRLQLGERKKLMDAINRRKTAFDDSGEVYDSRL